MAPLVHECPLVQSLQVAPVKGNHRNLDIGGSESYNFLVSEVSVCVETLIYSNTHCFKQHAHRLQALLHQAASCQT